MKVAEVIPLVAVAAAAVSRSGIEFNRVKESDWPSRIADELQLPLRKAFFVLDIGVCAGICITRRLKMHISPQVVLGRPSEIIISL